MADSIPMMRCGGVWLRFIVAIALVVAACAPFEVRPPEVPAPTSARAYVLLADNELLVVDAVSGATRAGLSLASRGRPASTMRVMALSSDATRLFVLVSDSNRQVHVVSVDVIGLRISATFELADGGDYRGLSVGARSGRVYIFANKDGDAFVQVLDPGSGQIVQRWTARPSGGRDWLIYQGAVSRDELTLYISYHGPDTTGIDRFEIRGTALERCSLTVDPDSGCFRTHGAFALSPTGLLAATGGPTILLLDPKTGSRLAEYDLRLEGNHLMEFAVSARGLYAIGSCSHAGGFARIDLATRQTQVVVQPGLAGVFCGERIVALAEGSLLVVTKTAGGVPVLAPTTLLVLSADGRILRSIEIPADPVDVLLLP